MLENGCVLWVFVLFSQIAFGILKDVKKEINNSNIGAWDQVTLEYYFVHSIRFAFDEYV